MLPENTSSVRTRTALWCGEKEKEKIANAEYIKNAFPMSQSKFLMGMTMQISL